MDGAPTVSAPVVAAYAVPAVSNPLEQNFLRFVAGAKAMSPDEQALQVRYTKPAVDKARGNMFVAVNDVSSKQVKTADISMWEGRKTHKSALEKELDQAATTPGFGVQFTPIKIIKGAKAKCSPTHPGRCLVIEK